MSMAISTIKAFLEKQGCIFNVANPPEIQEIYLGFLENTDQGIVALQKYLNGQSYTKNRIQQITTKFISDQLYKNFLVYLNTPTVNCFQRNIPQNQFNLKNMKQISQQMQSIEQFLQSFSLDSLGNKKFLQRNPLMQNRGGLPYFQPNGWIRYGLNVKKFTQLDGNDNWLRKDGNDGQWGVFYYCLWSNQGGQQVKRNIKNIIQSQFKPEPARFHIQLFVPKVLYDRLKKNPNALQQYKKEKIVGIGVHGTPLINSILPYTTTPIKFGNQQYRIALQCRIHPEKVYISEKVYKSDSIKSQWIVRDPKYIRPYGLLIGKVSDIRRQQNITDKFQRQYKQFEGTRIDLQKVTVNNDCKIM